MEESPRQFLAGHSGHDHVRDEQIDGPFMLLYFFQSSRTVARFDYAIAAGFQKRRRLVYAIE